MNALLVHTPALLIALPFLAAALAAIGTPRIAAAIAALVACGVAALAFAYAFATVGVRPLIYAFGGFAPPAGVTFRIDDFNIAPILLIATIGAMAALYAAGGGADSVPERRRPLAFALLLLEIGALLGVVATGDAFNLFVFLEVASVAAYALIALGGEQDRRGFKAAFDYLIFGALGASFYVVGVGFLYMATGSLNLADVTAKLLVTPSPQIAAAAFGFLFTGLALKAALFPLHAWLPRAYAAAPPFVTALLAGASSAAAIVVLCRIVFGVFGAGHPMVAAVLQMIAAPLGVMAILWGGIRAVYARDVLVMLSYSAVAEAGFLFLGLSFGLEAGLAALMVKIIADGLGKPTLFLSAAATRGLGVESLRGLYERQPVVAAALGAGLLSTIGVPLTLGFIGKWLLVDAALARGWPWAAAAMIAGSVLSVLYAGRAVERMFFRPGPAPLEEARVSFLSLAPILLGASLLVILGVAAAPVVDMARAGAAELMSGGLR